MEKEEIVVKYYYVKKTKVIVEYIDYETGERLSEEITIEGHEKDKYKAEIKDFEGYKLIAVPENLEGEMTAETRYVRLYYIKSEKIPKPTESPIPTETPQPTNTPNPTKSPVPTELPKPTEKPSNTSPNTGDSKPIVAGIMIVIIALMNIIYKVIDKRKK